MKRDIAFSPPDISELEIAEVCNAMRSGWITTGPRVKEFERKLAEYCHTNRVVCLSSATAAAELNFRVLGIKEGDEVIVPAYTYTASASAAIHVGAKVIFVDSQKDSYEMDYEKLEEAITDKTKAIVPVDLGGILCDYNRIYQAVNKKKEIFKACGKVQEALGRVAICADAAHAFGASAYGKMAGEWADFTSFSFHAVKNLTTAEGGAATWASIPGIDDNDLYKQYQLYSLHGQSKDALAKSKFGAWEYDVIGPWYKCNMTDVAAAIGLKQLERYPEMLKRRREIISQYDAMCERIGISYLRHYTDDSASSGHLYLVRVPGIDEKTRNEIIVQMADYGIACNVHYKPLPMMSAYKELGWDIKDFPNAYHYYCNVITLPLHTKLSDDDVIYIIDCFTEIVKGLKK